MRFIGSKEKLLPFIEEVLRRRVGDQRHRIADLFCGTASVSRLFKSLGHDVVANDNLRLGYVLAQAALNISSEPGFQILLDTEEFPSSSPAGLFPSPYDRVLAYLNCLPPKRGFFTREYSPAETGDSETSRLYFSEANARKIDAIRETIARWKRSQFISGPEHCLLLSDLMRAANRVANIAGTYGCFMRHWDARAKSALQLQRSIITRSSSPNRIHKVFCQDANLVAAEHEFNVVYLDPPYTWRHYGAYYHILETLAQEDEPRVSGITGLRS